MSSIKRTLTYRLIVGFALLLAVFGFLLDKLIGDRLTQEFDNALLAKSNTLITLTTQNMGQVEFDFADEFMPEYQRSVNPEYFQLWHSNGAVIEKSRSLKTNNLPNSLLPNIKTAFHNYQLPTGILIRVLTQSFVPHTKDKTNTELPTTVPVFEEFADISAIDPTNSINITVGKNVKELNELIRSIRISFLLGLVILLVLTIVTIRYSLERSFSPIVELKEQIQKIDASKLNNRVSLLKNTRELTPIIEQLNDLLIRLDNSFQREKRFADNVAHEFRTSLAELRVIADVGKMVVDDKDKILHYLNDLEFVSNKLENIVSSLLMLARYESGEAIIENSVIAVNDLFAANWALYTSEIEAKNIACQFEIPLETAIVSDKPKLELIISNLLSNAITYCPDNTTISVTANTKDSILCFSITNKVQELNKHDLDFIFDHFWQKDASRTNENHVGLGLSLVKALAKVLNIEVQVELNAQDIFSFTLSGLKIA